MTPARIQVRLRGCLCLDRIYWKKKRMERKESCELFLIWSFGHAMDKDIKEMTCWTVTSYCNNVSMPLMLRGLRRRKKICHERGRMLLVQSTNHTI